MLILIFFPALPGDVETRAAGPAVKGLECSDERAQVAEKEMETAAAAWIWPTAATR